MAGRAATRRRARVEDVVMDRTLTPSPSRKRERRRIAPHPEPFVLSLSKDCSS
jgi:hypothetical protein